MASASVGSPNASVVWPGLAQIGAYSRYVFLPIISGFPGDHQLLFMGGTGRIYYKGRVGMGVDSTFSGAGATIMAGQ